jgi:hypothetical protein
MLYYMFEQDRWAGYYFVVEYLICLDLTWLYLEEHEVL